MNKNEVKLKWEEWLAVIAMCVMVAIIVAAAYFILSVKNGITDNFVASDYVKGNTQPITSTE